MKVLKFALGDSHAIAASALVGVAVALATTRGFGTSYSWFDEQRMALGIVFVTLALACVVARSTVNEAVLPLSGASLLVLLVGAVSSCYAARPVAAFAEWAVIAVFFALVASAVPTTSTGLSLASAALSSIIASAYAVGVLANVGSAWLTGVALGSDTFLVGFANPRFPAQLEALTLPFLPLAVSLAPKRSWRLALGFVFALWWMCLIGSGSRTAWLALSAAAVVCVATSSPGRTWAWAQIKFAAFGALLFILIFVAIPRLFGVSALLEQGRFTEAGSIQARFELYRLALRAMLEHPTLGVGPMHFAYVNNGLGAHPHNFWLMLGAEWGVPVMVVSLVLAASLWLALLRRARALSLAAEDGQVRIALLASYTVWLVGTQFDGYMVVPTSQLLSATVLMLCVSSLGAPIGSTAAGHASRAVNAAWVVFALIASVVLVAIPFTSFGHVTKREAAWRKENPTGFLWPRFWEQGWIGPDSDPTAR